MPRMSGFEWLCLVACALIAVGVFYASAQLERSPAPPTDLQRIGQYADHLREQRDAAWAEVDRLQWQLAQQKQP